MNLDEATAMADLDVATEIQTRCIDAATARRDVLAVIATGGGKSAIYQITGPMVGGVTIVVVPLLALAHDQMQSIERTDLPPAVGIDGSTTAREREDVYSRLEDGQIEFLFVTPESLNNDDLRRALRSCHVSLFVVDEAHCVVTWGQSFRSDYLLLGEIRRELGSPTCIALTASADARLRGDIERLLGLDDPLIAVLPLTRSNIDLSLHTSPTRDESRAALVDYLATARGKAVAYVPTRKLCVELSQVLRDAGREAYAYHGQLTSEVRQDVTEAIRDTEDVVVVATNAFGMGIDIPDISTIVHLDMPATLIDYYQEVGRAGRDGSPAAAVAFVSLRKNSRRTFTAGVHRVSAEDCAAVFGAVRAGVTSRRAVADRVDLSIGRVTRAVTVLAMTGAIDADRKLAVADAEVTFDQIEDMCAQREEFDRSQRVAVDAYRTSDVCRWQQLVGALGEVSDPCGRCDNCMRDPEAISEGTDRPGDARIGASVTHEAFGSGRIVSIEGSVAQMVFEEVGPKTLDLDACVRDGLVMFDQQ